jgi:hypothetical protein
MLAERILASANALLEGFPLERLGRIPEKFGGRQPRVLRFSGSQVLRFSGSQVLRFSGSQVRVLRFTRFEPVNQNQ